MPTIDEIAKLSNVSKTTVSRVLNDHPYVSEEKGSGFWKSSKNWTTSRTRLHESSDPTKRCFSQCLSHTRTTPSSLSL